MLTKGCYYILRRNLIWSLYGALDHEIFANLIDDDNYFNPRKKYMRIKTVVLQCTKVNNSLNESDGICI